MRNLLIAFAALPLIAATAPLPAPPTGPEAAIVGFAQDGWADYKIDGARGVYVLAQSGQWYYARTQDDCPRLASADGFGVDTSVGGRLDRYSALTVSGERCQLSSVVKSPSPPGYRAKGHA